MYLYILFQVVLVAGLLYGLYSNIKLPLMQKLNGLVIVGALILALYQLNLSLANNRGELSLIGSSRVIQVVLFFIFVSVTALVSHLEARTAA